MHESNFEMLVCLVYASCQRHAARSRPLGSVRNLARLLDGQSSYERHLFAAVSLTSPQSALEAETACHSVSSGRSAAQNDVQRFRDGPVH